MKKRNILLVLFFLITLSYPIGAQEKKEILSNVFTLELAFGDKDVPDEYLLARPILLAVNDAGDIYVFDEYKVKVFDKSGKPKTIFGGRGQGPGEFDSPILHYYISPTDWLTITEFFTYSIFSSANKFIEKNRYSFKTVFNSLKNDYKISIESTIQNIFALSEKELIIGANSSYRENYNEEGEYYDYLFYANGDKASIIAKYRKTDNFVYKSKSGVVSSIETLPLGTSNYAILPGLKILFTHTYNDVKFSTKTAQLTFHIVSLTNNMKNEFAVTYPLEAIPDSVIKLYDPDYVEKMQKEPVGQMKQQNPQLPLPLSKMSDEQKETYKKIMDALKQRKFNPLFTSMQLDGVYLFLRCSSSDNKMSLIKVINAETGKEVSNFTQPSNFYLDSIKNGCGYLSTTPKDGYPIVEKYRIDPRVYGK